VKLDLSQKEEQVLRMFLEQGAEENIWTEEQGSEGGWKRLHVEKFHNLYASANTIRVMESRGIIWTRHVARTRVMRNVQKNLVGKSERKRRRRWKGGIRMDFQDIECEDVDWIHLSA
jgi:hypothetical protein